MPESQVTPQATPPQATSPSQPEPQRQQEPPRRVGDLPRKAAKKPSGAADEQQAQRAKQMEVRAQVEKKNPFSPANRASRMQDVMKTLREQRGVAEPREKGAHEQGEQAARSSDAGDGASQPTGESSDGVSRDAAVENKAAPQDEQPEWYKREQAMQQSERKAADALANAERERAASEKAKADAEAAVQRLADAKDDPIAFMAEAGMTKDEWNAYVANGGQLSAEQKKLRTMAENMAKMQARLDAAEKNAQVQQEQARLAAEDAGFAPSLQEMTFVPQMGGMAAVRARQSLLSQKTGQPVSLRDAAQHLEQEMGTGLERLLQNPKIRSSLKLDVNTSDARQAAEQPRTLNNTVSAQSSQTEAKPHPLDFAAKRKLWAQRVRRDQEARTGR